MTTELSPRARRASASSGARPGPQFVVIGAQKSGTTWLYSNLKVHDGLWLPPEKELHYFDEKRYDRSSLLGRIRRDRRWRRQFKHQVSLLREDFSADHLRWSLRYLTRPPDDDWYLSLFAPGGTKVTGEITPSYSAIDAEQVAAFHRLLPDTKIVFLMRHPVERAWSAAMMGVLRGRRGLERVRARVQPAGSSADADSLVAHAESDQSVPKTDYARTLDLWSAHYDPGRIFVGFLEDIHFRPAELLTSICSFLGVSDRDDWPTLRTRVYSGSADTIPASFACRLAERYEPLVTELESRIGSYASWWRYVTEQLLAGVEGSSLTYPFYEGHLWEAWLARGEMERDADGMPRLQSATLAELEARVA
jgi:hypothetical protein